MLDILIKNGMVVTQNEKREIKKINIGINNGIITYLGKDVFDAKKIINAEKYIITPAYLNAHLHFGEYYLRGYQGKLTTENYILAGEKFHKKFESLNQEIRNSSINNVICESIKSGTLTLFGVRGWPNALHFPINSFLGYPIMNSNKLSKYSTGFESKFFELKKAKNVEYFLGLHSVKWVEENTLIRISNFIQQNPGVKLSLHICETMEEIKYIKEKYGMTPIELLKKYNLLNENVLLVHCNYLSEIDYKLMKESNVSVAVCHSSNLKLQNNPCKIEKLLQHGINVMIATDGPATADSLSLLENLKISALISNVEEQTLFDMITINPAKYMKINTGSIIKENKADLLFYKKDDLNFTYTQSIINNLIYLTPNNPELIMKDGKTILKNHKFTEIKEDDIISEKNRIIKILESSV